MKKVIVVMLAVVSAATTCFSANTVSWYRDDGTVRDVDGTTPLPTSANYTIMLVETASGGSSTSIGFVPSTQSIGSGETLLASFTWSTWPSVIGPGSFYSDVSGGNIGNVLTGDHIYSVIINNTATYYSVLDGVSPTTVTLDGASNFDYNVSGNNTWQPVPEPSSIALLGLGLGLVALRRKMRK